MHISRIGNPAAAAIGRATLRVRVDITSAPIGVRLAHSLPVDRLKRVYADVVVGDRVVTAGIGGVFQCQVEFLTEKHPQYLQ